MVKVLDVDVVEVWHVEEVDVVEQEEEVDVKIQIHLHTHVNKIKKTFFLENQLKKKSFIIMMSLNSFMSSQCV